MGIENPHDKLDPVTSKDIIIAHVTDGVRMLEEYHIPQEIIDIAGQHHGTTLLKYFIIKLLKKIKKNIQKRCSVIQVQKQLRKSRQLLVLLIV